MQARTSNKKLISIYTPIMAFIAILLVAVIVASVIFADSLSLWFYGAGNSQISDETIERGSQLTEDIVEEGTVLLKNDNALPLTDSEIAKVNVFGWAAYDWMTSAFGSGFSNTELHKVKLFPALEEAGIEYNETLYNMYKTFYSKPIANKWGMTLDEYRGDVEVGTDQKFILHEPGTSYYTDAVLNEAREFSSVALVVIGRTGGEAADLRTTQTKQVQTNNSSATTLDNDRTYLQLSVEEEQMIEAAKKACSKVIVLLNTSNTMELGFIDDPEIDAAMLVGLTGLTGVRAVIDLLRGHDEEGNPVSPSGRTADTYAYDIASAPSTVNSGYGGATKYQGLDPNNDYKKGYFDAYIDYHEGIYVGYRYYETAWYEATQGNYADFDYDQTVQYPFGYGLSYASFEWSVTKVTVNGVAQSSGVAQLGKNDKISIEVTVKNTSSTYSGKEVVQLYYTAPYTKGKVEKAHVVLADFAKTGLLAPGQTQTVTLNVSAQSMASYDAYDKNGNSHTGYELDGGEYTLKLMKNSHELADMGESSLTSASLTYTVPAAGYNYDTDEATGATVENRLTGNGTIDGYPIDGSKETTPVTYLSRSDFAGTFPKEKIIRARSAEAYAVASADAPTEAQLAATGYTNVSMPLTGNVQGFVLDDMIDCEGYDDEFWDYIIEQLTRTELFELIRDGFFKTDALESIGKPIFLDLDGPLGLNTRVTSNASCKFVSYPSETLLAQTWNVELAYEMGEIVATEARESQLGIRGWYGPAANIHRNPYGGRNAEYYSEDSLLSGKFTAETVRGAKENGLYCYIKHFVANDSESLREGLYTFMTEQTFREIYLRPFEIAVKEGGANALMSSMNRIGATWVGASRAVCTDILRGEWGFEGAIVTDWVDTGSKHMPVYKGIWAGNDIWLNNADSNPMFNDSEYSNNAVFVTLAQKVARDVLWMLIDTEQTMAEVHPELSGGSVTSGGYEFNRSWVWWLDLPICAVLLIAEGVLAYFLVTKIRKNNAQNSEVQQS